MWQGWRPRFGNGAHGDRHGGGRRLPEGSERDVAAAALEASLHFSEIAAAFLIPPPPPFGRAARAAFLGPRSTKLS